MKSLIWLCGNQEKGRTAWYIRESVYMGAVLFFTISRLAKRDGVCFIPF